MDDATPTDDWAAVLQERFLSDLARVEASEQLTPRERACLQEVMELQPREVHRLMIAAQGGRQRIWPVFLSCSRPITRH